MRRRAIGTAAVLSFLLISMPAFAEEGWRLEGFAGYYIAEELDEEISYGARGAWNLGNVWGLMAAYETIESTGPGFGERFGVETSIEHFELSLVAQAGNGFELLAGIGATRADSDLEVPGAAVDLDKTSFSVHSAIAYRADLGDVLYLRPEVRARIYKIGDETVDISASLALGFRFGGN